MIQFLFEFFLIPIFQRNKNLSSNDLNEQNSQQKSLHKPKIDRTRRRTAEDYNEAAKFLAATESKKNVPLSKYSDSNLLKGEHNSRFLNFRIYCYILLFNLLLGQFLCKIFYLFLCFFLKFFNVVQSFVYFGFQYFYF